MKAIRKLSIMLSLLLTFVILLPFAGCTKIPGENHMGILVSEEVQRENNLRLLSKGIDDPDRSAPIYGGQSYLFELQILPDNDPEALRSAKFTLAWDGEYDTPIEDCLTLDDHGDGTCTVDFIAPFSTPALLNAEVMLGGGKQTASRRLHCLGGARYADNERDLPTLLHIEYVDNIGDGDRSFSWTFYQGGLEKSESSPFDIEDNAEFLARFDIHEDDITGKIDEDKAQNASYSGYFFVSAAIPFIDGDDTPYDLERMDYVLPLVTFGASDDDYRSALWSMGAYHYGQVDYGDYGEADTNSIYTLSDWNRIPKGQEVSWIEDLWDIRDRPSEDITYCVFYLNERFDFERMLDIACVGSGINFFELFSQDFFIRDINLQFGYSQNVDDGAIVDFSHELRITRGQLQS